MSAKHIRGKDGGITFFCDSKGCTHNYDADSDDFKEGWAEAREYGWTASQFTGVWKHHCPECDKKLGG